MSSQRARGTTLIELMVGLGIAVIGLAAIAAVVAAAGQLAMNTEMAVASNDVTRGSVETLVNSLRNGGYGAQNGLVVRAGGLAVVVNPIYGTNGTGLNFSDELWVLVPHRGAMLEGCQDKGAAMVLPGPASTTGNLPLAPCVTGAVTNSLWNGATLLVSGGMRGALLTNAAINPGDIGYAEIGTSGFGSDAFGNGFNAGDQVFPARVLHYFISMPGAPCPTPGPLPAAIPDKLLPECAPGLYVSESMPNIGASNPPFVDVNPGGALVMSNVEDLQVAYGVDMGPTQGNPLNYVFQNGLAPTPFTASLRSVRISIVSRTARKQASSDTGNAVSTSSAFRPLSIEDHVPPAGPPDGYRRTVYTRRVELLNLAPRSM